MSTDRFSCDRSHLGQEWRLSIGLENHVAYLSDGTFAGMHVSYSSFNISPFCIALRVKIKLLIII